MKIDMKIQTARSTKFIEKINNFNASLNNFEVGLETRKWGDGEELNPKITFEIEEQNYSMPLKIFIEKAKTTIKLLSEKYGETN